MRETRPEIAATTIATTMTAPQERILAALHAISAVMAEGTLIQAEADVEFSPDEFIAEEDNVVIVSRDGWVKRQKEVKDLQSTRLREGDAVLACFAGSTRATCVFFTNVGVAYTCRIVDVPA